MQERILETADRLFYGQGIRAVGVDTIAAEIGISKRTLYNHFPSKDDLIVAYLSRRLKPAPPSDRPPLDQILGAFDRLERTIATGVFRGCPFVNAVAELKEPAHAANKIALAFKEQRRAWFRGFAGEARCEGRGAAVDAAPDPDRRRHCSRHRARRSEGRGGGARSGDGVAEGGGRQATAKSQVGSGLSTRCRSSTGGL